MGDIAEAARRSRPALYLVFSSNEEILTAVMARLFTAVLDDIRQGLARFATAKEKLTFAFDVWCVRPF
jgi:AcrR family transcriptional regulator